MKFYSIFQISSFTVLVFCFSGTWEAQGGRTSLLLAVVSQDLKGKMLPLNDNDIIK